MASAMQLKDQGNKFFAAKKYPAAYTKYSEALKLDVNNAVLFANRAACLLAMKKYADAASDCRQATKIDPQCTKAWMRLGTALSHMGQYSESIRMYTQAQETLPKQNLTPDQQNLIRQCDVELDTIRQRVAQGAKFSIIQQEHEHPWVRARQIVEKFKSEQPTAIIPRTSATTLLDAYDEFKGGVDMVRALQTSGPLHAGCSDGLTSLTNGLMRDTRVFHIPDKDFIQKYNMQARMEIENDSAHVTGGAQGCIEHARHLMEEGGWDPVRFSIGTTIRFWVMRAYMESSLKNNFDGAMAFYNDAVEVLEWGRQEWRGEHRETRGAVFQDTFVRGVKSLRLETLIKATNAKPDKYSLDDMRDAALEIIQDVDTSGPPPPGLLAGFFESFYVLPKAHANAAVALYYREMARLNRNDPEVFADYLKQSAESYIEAASAVPVDDEYCAWYTYCALEMDFHRHAPVKDVLPLFKHLHASVTAMTPIWEFSSTMVAHNRQREQLLNKMVQRGVTLWEDIQNGKTTEEDLVSWDEVL